MNLQECLDKLNEHISNKTLTFFSFRENSWLHLHLKSNGHKYNSTPSPFTEKFKVVFAKLWTYIKVPIQGFSGSRYYKAQDSDCDSVCCLIRVIWLEMNYRIFKYRTLLKSCWPFFWHRWYSPKKHQQSKNGQSVSDSDTWHTSWHVDYYIIKFFISDRQDTTWVPTRLATAGSGDTSRTRQPQI